MQELSVQEGIIDTWDEETLLEGNVTPDSCLEMAAVLIKQRGSLINNRRRTPFSPKTYAIREREIHA